AIVMLTVDLDRLAADVAQQSRGDARTAGKGAAAPVVLERAADDERFAGLDCDALLLEQCERRMFRRKLDLGRHGRLILSGANESGVSPRAERQAQSIEQD